MRIYVDPTSKEWPRPNLIDGLMKKPTTEKKAPLEDQCTVALAWLLDRWPAFATGFARLCSEGDPDGGAAAAVATRIGARVWVTLPKLDGSVEGQMYPDLS